MNSRFLVNTFVYSSPFIGCLNPWLLIRKGKDADKHVDTKHSRNEILCCYSFVAKFWYTTFASLLSGFIALNHGNPKRPLRQVATLAQSMDPQEARVRNSPADGSVDHRSRPDSTFLATAYRLTRHTSKIFFERECFQRYHLVLYPFLIVNLSSSASQHRFLHGIVLWYLGKQGLRRRVPMDSVAPALFSNLGGHCHHLRPERMSSPEQRCLCISAVGTLRSCMVAWKPCGDTSEATRKCNCRSDRRRVRPM